MYRQIRFITVSLSLIFALSGCGLKGPLYQPTEQLSSLSTTSSNLNQPRVYHTLNTQHFGDLDQSLLAEEAH
jgi:predicted small lipoprotein YifL